MPFEYKLPSGRIIIFVEDPMREFTSVDIQKFEEISMAGMTEEAKTQERHRMASECRSRARMPVVDSGFRDRFEDGVACSRPGCLSYAPHPCEGCGRIAGRYVRTLTTKQHKAELRSHGPLRAIQ